MLQRSEINKRKKERKKHEDYGIPTCSNGGTKHSPAHSRRTENRPEWEEGVFSMRRIRL
jgi:hypothetical protein